MNIKDWVQKLNGKEYGWELSKQELEQVKQDGIIIAYGDSDDLLEFRGCIYDEISAYNGTIAKLTKDLTVFNEDENKENFAYNKSEIDKMKTIKAIWEPKDDQGNIFASWKIETDIPHETFNIMEDEELFGIGIIFDKKYILENK
jgi:hypothetical protein